MGLVAAVAIPLAQAASTQSSHEIDDGRRWLESPALLTPASPAILRAAEAVALNKATNAEALLRGIIRSQPRSEAASQADQLLSRIYLRSGQYRRLLANLDEWARGFTRRDDIERERMDVEQFRGLPDQENGPRRTSILRHDADSLFVPVSINNRLASYFFDTGAWVSVMTESEATRHGLQIREGGGVISDPSEKGVKSRFTVVRELAIGSMRFRNVSFLVLPNQGPFTGMAGLIGMPVLLGVGSIRWSNDATVEFGGRADPNDRNPPNLVFYRNRLLLRALVSGRPSFATFDTGAVSTDLNANFATQFAELVERNGTRVTQDTTGAGGTTLFDAIRLPEVAFEIDGVQRFLHPAVVTLQRTPNMGGDCCIGNVGKDLLTQGRGFSIDFTAMTLSLH
ncbi:MAG TPA: retropepsin-like aspartic protease [Vicinamibacterales bacterium]